MKFIALLLLGISGIAFAVPNEPAGMKQDYTPGLGEFMSSIQMRHAKLWFAAKRQELAACGVGGFYPALGHCDDPVFAGAC